MFHELSVIPPSSFLNHNIPTFAADLGLNLWGGGGPGGGGESICTMSSLSTMAGLYLYLYDANSRVMGDKAVDVDNGITSMM